MISLKQLINVSNFPEEFKNEVLGQINNLPQEKINALSETCWGFISAEYENKLRFELQKMTDEIAKGEKNYTQEDFDKAEEILFNELAQKLEAIDTDAKIEEVKKKLGEHSVNQNPISQTDLSSDNSSNSN
jgi:hypothetical protein